MAFVCNCCCISGEFDEVSDLPEDFDPSAELPDAAIPEGWSAVPECPADLRRLSGRKVLFRWDCGWLLGVVKNPIRKGKYNYFVRY